MIISIETPNLESLSFKDQKLVLKEMSDDLLEETRTIWQRNLKHGNTDFIAFLKLSTHACSEWGVRQEFWEDFDESGPIPFPTQIKLEDLPEGATTANIAVMMDVFPSLTQARKNNVNASLTKGPLSFRKGKIRVIII